MRATPKAGTAVSRCADTAGRPATGRSPVGVCCVRRLEDPGRRPMHHAAQSHSWSRPRSAFAGFRVPAEGIVVAVRRYLRYAPGVPRASRSCSGDRGVAPRAKRYADNAIEPGHGQLKRRLRPTRGLRTDHTAQVVIAGRAFVRPAPRCEQRPADPAPCGELRADVQRGRPWPRMSAAPRFLTGGTEPRGVPSYRRSRKPGGLI